jgi:integrase/recombinase XerD
MNSFAPTLQSFFTEWLVRQRQVSQHTVAAYRDTFRLLLAFAQQATGRAPSQLDWDNLDAPLIAAFLEHLETERHNSIRTRNARLAAVHSLFRFAALRHPEHAALIQRVLAMPQKRGERNLVAFLEQHEIDALLAAPDRSRWVGRRDHAMLLLAIQTGLRVSEITTLTCQDARLGTGAHVWCRGKGRKERVTPLTDQTVAVLRTWLAERHDQPTAPLFPGPSGAPLTRDAVALIVSKHATTASARCPSLMHKKVSPHVLRHTCAMQLLHAGVDTSTIALWLGHESAETTQIYLHADLALKERALARTTPPDAPAGRYQPPDTLLAFLEAL